MTMAAPWEESYERARRAHAEWMAEEAADAEREYRFEACFTIPDAVARDCRVAMRRDPDGLRVKVEFFATEEAKAKVLDVIAALPVTCRSCQRWYDEGPEGVNG